MTFIADAPKRVQAPIFPTAMSPLYIPLISF